MPELLELLPAVIALILLSVSPGLDTLLTVRNAAVTVGRATRQRKRIDLLTPR
jgi:threonine/homoserine/homoserine lactone efflux protein